jgi:hypothetical protein
MPVRIAPYSEQDIPAVQDFNRRLQAGGAPPDYVFSESHVSAWLPPHPGAPVYNGFYLAIDDGTVRGTYVLKHQEFAFHGEIRPVVYYHHPFSEGIIDKKYAQVGLQMLMHAMRAHPVLYALGMGGYDRPLPRMLMAMKWNHCLIPFYFRVNHPGRFLRNMQAFRQSRGKRVATDAAAFTGAGWVGLKTIHAVAGFRGLRTRAEADEVAEFEDWADELWRKCGPKFAMIAVRDARSLRALYPASNGNFLRLRVTADGRTLGWAVVADVRQSGHAQYGNLRVGTILDCLAQPEDAARVMAAATRVLCDRGVDVITSNQSHGSWVQGLKECGFLKGPSNFIFAASRKLSELIQPFDQTVPLSHWNRGDGDNLLQYA